MKAREQNFTKGRSGEEEAKNYLEAKGFEWVESNYSNDIGEIDLIMIDKKWLVFVEVKYKTDDKFGLPEEMIGKKKLAKVKRVAEIYLMLNPDMRRKFAQQRIDGVCILGDEIRHYPNIYE